MLTREGAHADIGGSLIKLVYFSSDRSFTQPDAPITHGGRLHFKKWETKNYQECINYIKKKRRVPHRITPAIGAN